MSIGFLASGNLGLSTLQQCKRHFIPRFVATDNKSVGIIDYAKKNEIPLFIGNPRGGRLIAFLQKFKIETLLSVNYLFIIEPDVIKFAKYPINFHGSLLPKYRGRTPHVWAIINGETTTGVTAHMIERECDSGAIIMQKEVEIASEDTGASILAKFESIYPEMIFETLKRITLDKVQIKPQNHSMATFFGKRTPADGQIDWNWEKQRLKDWVRAQAYPYPGAFTILSDEKIIIDKVTFSDIAFNESDPNGLVLADYPDIIVKTSNGGIRLDDIRTNRRIIQRGKILGK